MKPKERGKTPSIVDGSWFSNLDFCHRLAGGCLFDCEGHFSVGDGVGLGQDEIGEKTCIFLRVANGYVSSMYQKR